VLATLSMVSCVALTGCGNSASQIGIDTIQWRA